MTTVGSRYQVVIDRQSRRKLGIRPGWVAVQTVVGDHLEVRFLPPAHDRSLAGSLKAHARKALVPEDEMKRRAWEHEGGSRRGQG